MPSIFSYTTAPHILTLLHLLQHYHSFYYSNTTTPSTTPTLPLLLLQGILHSYSKVYHTPTPRHTTTPPRYTTTTPRYTTTTPRYTTTNPTTPILLPYYQNFYSYVYYQYSYYQCKFINVRAVVLGSTHGRVIHNNTEDQHFKSEPFSI